MRRLASGEVSITNCANYIFVASLGGFQLALGRNDPLLTSSVSLDLSSPLRLGANFGRIHL